jgi:hypothetical protein
MAGILDDDLVSTRPALEPQLSAKVDEGGSMIKLSGQLLAAAAFVSRRRELINRLFSIPDVGRAKVERRLGAITLWFLKGGFQRSELLEALAVAMRLAKPAGHSFPNQHLLSRPEFRDEFEVHRAGPKLTLWQISRDRPNTLRLFHALLANDTIKTAVIDAVLSLVGVTAALSRRSNAIQISCQPGVFSIWALLEVIDSALAHALPLSKRPKARMELRPALIRANLALAPIADYVFPPVGLSKCRPDSRPQRKPLKSRCPTVGTRQGRARSALLLYRPVHPDHLHLPALGADVLVFGILAPVDQEDSPRR